MLHALSAPSITRKCRCQGSTAMPHAQVAWRYSCLYFYERSYEAGGRIFELLFSLMVRRS